MRHRAEAAQIEIPPICLGIEPLFLHTHFEDIQDEVFWLAGIFVVLVTFASLRFKKKLV